MAKRSDNRSLNNVKGYVKLISTVMAVNWSNILLQMVNEHTAFRVDRIPFDEQKCQDWKLKSQVTPFGTCAKKNLR